MDGRTPSSLLPSRMIVIQKVVTDEGEEIPFQLTDLECGTEVDGENDRVFLLWPVTIGHKVGCYLIC